MRKNWTMRAGVLMLALTLITSCFVGGTFAKYVADGKGISEARVAKFGVKVTASGDAFNTAYETENNDDEAKIGANSVISSNDDKVVAPGTDGQLTAVKITGNPEVAVKIDYTADIELTGWTVNGGDFYCPIIITVGEIGDSNYSQISMTTDGVIDANSFAEAVKSAVEAYTEYYPAGTEMSKAKPPKITWEWPFETGTGDEIKANDIKDTYLGDQAAEGNASEIKLNFTATVTQID